MLLLAAAAILLYDSASRNTTEPSSPQPPDQVNGPGLGGLEPTLSPHQAQQRLDQLPAATGAVVVPYERAAYGNRWADVNSNGCNQRDDVLLRDAIPETVTVATHGSCRHDVLAGSWLDPNTGRLLHFDDLKDPTQSQAITINHLVSVSLGARPA